MATIVVVVTAEGGSPLIALIGVPPVAALDLLLTAVVLQLGEELTAVPLLQDIMQDITTRLAPTVGGDHGAVEHLWTLFATTRVLVIAVASFRNKSLRRF